MLQDPVPNRGYDPCKIHIGNDDAGLLFSPRGSTCAVDRNRLIFHSGNLRGDKWVEEVDHISLRATISPTLKLIRVSHKMYIATNLEGRVTISATEPKDDHSQ